MVYFVDNSKHNAWVALSILFPQTLISRIGHGILNINIYESYNSKVNTPFMSLALNVNNSCLVSVIIHLSIL